MAIPGKQADCFLDCIQLFFAFEKLLIIFFEPTGRGKTVFSHLRGLQKDYSHRCIFSD